MEIGKSNKNLKKLYKYCCDFCDFKCYQKCDWDRHIVRPKHLNKSQGNCQETQKLSKNFFCKCGSEFKTNSGLWKHKQKCKQTICDDTIVPIKQNNEQNDVNDDDEYMYQGINIKDKDALVLHLLKQNGELQNKILEMASQVNVTNNGSHNTTNIDKSFNINLFLNETCKNAMNMSDFINSIQLSLDDLEHTGRTGYIEGISNIILKNLNSLEQNMRPLHCSDLKREVLYIKDNDQWQRESENKPIITNMIKTIANENIKQIGVWRSNHPDCTKADSKKNDLYLKIVSNSMNGLTKEEGEKNIHKIITNIAKKVTIEKGI
jgi:hypothetical protein